MHILSIPSPHTHLDSVMSSCTWTTNTKGCMYIIITHPKTQIHMHNWYMGIIWVICSNWDINIFKLERSHQKLKNLPYAQLLAAAQPCLAAVQRQASAHHLLVCSSIPCMNLQILKSSGKLSCKGLGYKKIAKLHKNNKKTHN